MNDWWKMALAGTAGAGLLAMTGGAAAPGLAALMGGEGAAAAGAGAAAAAGAGAEAAAAGTAAAAGAGAGAGAAGAAGATGATVGGLGGLGGAASSVGAGTAADAAMAYTTPAVAEGMLGSGAAGSGAAGAGAAEIPVTGILADAAPVTEGMLPGAYSDVAAQQYAFANQQPGMLAQGMGYAKDAGKAASAYSTMSGAAGGQPPPRQAPQGRPVFQGEAAPIAQQGQAAPMQSPVMQSGGNSGEMLRAIAQQRLRRHA